MVKMKLNLRVEDCLNRLIKFNEELLAEEAITQAELVDRIAKGLKGEAAITHYNEWMEKAGMKHLCVQRKS